MTTALMTMLVAQTLTFALWAVVAFRFLFGLMARARTLSGLAFPGPLWFGPALRDWWRDPARRNEKRALIGLTMLLFLVSVIAGLVAPR